MKAYNVYQLSNINVAYVCGVINVANGINVMKCGNKSNVAINQY